MSQFASSVTLRRLKTNNGVVGDKPRIYNVDRDSYCYGYAEVNTQAASPFVRTKVHKGIFEGGADVHDGDLILDRYDNVEYLVMSVKGIYAGGKNGHTAYLDGTLYRAPTVATIERLDATQTDFFGRTSSGYVAVNFDVRCMVNPQNFSNSAQPEELLQVDKIKVVLQGKVGVKFGDRIVTDQGDTFIVVNIDKSSLINLWVCMVDLDNR